VEHPHNEALNIASGVGFPAALCWVVFICIALRNRESSWEVRITLLMLFVMGLADKPLSVGPSALLFFIVHGLSLPKVELKESMPCLPLQKLMAVVVCAFGIFRLSQAVPGQYYSWQSENFTDRVKHGDKSAIGDLIKMTMKSSDADPYFILSHYKAAALLAQYTKDLSATEKYLIRALNTEPNFSDINGKIGAFYQQQASYMGEGEEKNALLKEAEMYIQRNSSLSPWNINRLRYALSFYASLNDYKKLHEELNTLKKVAQEKFRARYTYQFYDNMEKDLKDWIKNAKQGNSYPYQLLNEMKAEEGRDYLVDYFKDSYFSRFPLGPYNKLDDRFWQEQLTLYEVTLANGVAAPIDLLKLMKDFQLVEEQSISRPFKVFSSQKGSPESLATLLCNFARLCSFPAVQLRSEKQVYVVLYDNKSGSFIYDCTNQQVVPSEKLEGLLDETRNGTFKAVIELMPSQFVLRNQLLSDILSTDGFFPEFCRGGTEELLIIMPYLKGINIQVGKGLLKEFETHAKSVLLN
jgi:hypothetical protein